MCRPIAIYLPTHYMSLCLVRTGKKWILLIRLPMGRSRSSENIFAKCLLFMCLDDSDVKLGRCVYMHVKIKFSN